MHYKKSIGEKILDGILALFVIAVLVITLYPLIYVVSMSISDPIAAARGEVWLYPVGFDLTAIKKVLSDPKVLVYYGNTIFYTVAGTACGVIVTCLAAYPLSRREFRARRQVTKFFMFTMFFGGGLIPTYIVVARFLHLADTRAVIIILSLTTAWYISITRNYFQSLPAELVECARIDGASETRIFAQLILPLSKPILAVLALYKAVAHWNSYFTAMLYISDKKKQPLALYIRSLIIQNSLNSMNEGSVEAVSVEEMLSVLQLKYAVIVVSVLPMLIIYPFISKNLEKGLMIGAVKG